MIQTTHELNWITALSPLHSAKLTDEIAVQTVGDEGAERLPVARRRGSSSQGQSGGGALELAEMRLRGLAPRAVEVLERLLTAESERVALGAANSLADRSLGRATERIQVAAAVTVVKRPW